MRGVCRFEQVIDEAFAGKQERGACQKNVGVVISTQYRGVGVGNLWRRFVAMLENADNGVEAYKYWSQSIRAIKALPMNNHLVLKHLVNGSVRVVDVAATRTMLFICSKFAEFDHETISQFEYKRII